MTTSDATAAKGDAVEVARSSLMGLNGLNFFVADMLTAFGPFVTVYLTINAWAPADIGLALSVGTVVAILAQVPAGLLVDAVPEKRLIAAVGIGCVIVAALALALVPERWPVFTSQALLGFAGSLLTPAIAAITLTLVKSDRLGERFGGNVRFKALGSMSTALVMGYLGAHLGAATVFYVGAVFGVLALGCLWQIKGVDIVTAPARTQHPTALPRHARTERMRHPIELWRDPGLMALGACGFCFQLGNAALLPFAVSGIQAAGYHSTDLIVSVALIVSQAVTALVSPRLGARAQSHGRRQILLLGFGCLLLRCLLCFAYSGPIGIVTYQILDGISGATLGVMVPLVVADITHRGGRFNLGIGLVGFAISAGATLGTTTTGFVVEHMGLRVAFLCMAFAAGIGCLLVRFVLPETQSMSHSYNSGKVVPNAA